MVSLGQANRHGYRVNAPGGHLLSPESSIKRHRHPSEDRGVRVAPAVQVAGIAGVPKPTLGETLDETHLKPASKRADEGVMARSTVRPRGVPAAGPSSTDP
jgi:hypothetical protein